MSSNLRRAVVLAGLTSLLASAAATAQPAPPSTAQQPVGSQGVRLGFETAPAPAPQRQTPPLNQVQPSRDRWNGANASPDQGLLGGLRAPASGGDNRQLQPRTAQLDRAAPPAGDGSRFLPNDGYYRPARAGAAAAPDPSSPASTGALFTNPETSILGPPLTAGVGDERIDPNRSMPPMRTAATSSSPIGGTASSTASGLALAPADGRANAPAPRTNSPLPAGDARDAGLALTPSGADADVVLPGDASTPGAKNSRNAAAPLQRRLPMWLAMGLFFSVAMNLYFGWSAWDANARYQDLVDDVSESDARLQRQNRRSHGESEKARSHDPRGEKSREREFSRGVEV